MRPQYIAAALLTAALAAAPSNAADTKPASTEEHDHNHADSPGAAPAQKTPPGEASGQSGQMMKRMQEMHKKMMGAKTPEERQTLMDEHMKIMQEGMGMMKDMGKKSSPQAMQKRMDMMEMMMQMMMDREVMESGSMKK